MATAHRVKILSITEPGELWAEVSYFPYPPTGWPAGWYHIEVSGGTMVARYGAETSLVYVNTSSGDSVLFIVQ